MKRWTTRTREAMAYSPTSTASTIDIMPYPPWSFIGLVVAMPPIWLPVHQTPAQTSEVGGWVGLGGVNGSGSRGTLLQ